MLPILLNEISGDFLDSYERIQDLEITGTTQGVPDNTPIVITLNDKSYNSKSISGIFYVKIPSDDVQQLIDNTEYIITASLTLNGEIYEDTENVTTSVFSVDIQQIYAENVVETNLKRFVSDEEMEALRRGISNIEQTMFKGPTAPTEGVDEDDIWLDTVTDTLKIYREFPSNSGEFSWEPLIFKNNDILDGGEY